jgi:hypothetical protein
MEKCVFIGYPDGYKGWMFYNPTTKRTVISEHAEFNERYFPGLKHTPLTPEPFEQPPDVLFMPLPDLGGDSESDTNPIQNNHPPLLNLPQIAPVPQEPLPKLPATPPANPIPLEPTTPVSNHPPTPDHSPSPEPSPTIPLAIRQTRCYC